MRKDLGGCGYVFFAPLCGQGFFAPLKMASPPHLSLRSLNGFATAFIFAVPSFEKVQSKLYEKNCVFLFFILYMLINFKLTDKLPTSSEYLHFSNLQPTPAPI